MVAPLWAEPRTLEEVKPLAAAEASLWICSAAAPADVASAETCRALVAAAAAFVASTRCSAASVLRLVRWDVAPTADPAMREVAHRLGVRPPLSVLAIGRGELLDKVVGAEACVAKVVEGDFLVKFDAYVAGRALPPAVPTDAERRAEAIQTGLRERSVTLDIARLVEQGKALMARGEAFYAAKFFARALALLDCFEEDRDDDNISGSTALCIAWLTTAHIARGAAADAAPLLARLEADCLATFRVAGSEPSRAVALGRMVAAVSWSWTAGDCSHKALAAALALEPTAGPSREKLVVTLFLAGDMERCLTEALKLRVSGNPFGTVAMEAAADFLGAEHPLVVALR